MQTLICRICNAEKPEDTFSRKRKNSAARRDTCKDCHAEQERWYREQRKTVLGEDHPLLQRLPSPPRTPFEEPPERTCRLCKVTKPLDDFVWQDKHHKVHRNVCKPCNAETQDRLRAQRHILSTQPRTCTLCQQEKPADEFGWKQKKQFIRQPLCKSCAATQGQAFRAAQRTALGEEGMTELYKTRYADTRDGQLADKKSAYASDPELYKKRSRNYYADNKTTIAVKAAHRRLRTNFGLTMDDYTAMLESQGGVCAICRNANGRKLVVDHCHTSGRIRGLLCSPCNSFLGRIQESAEALERAKAYLL